MIDLQDAPTTVLPFLAAAVFGCLLLASPPVRADGPRRDARTPMFPPANCRSRACLRGSSQFHRGNYDEAARLLEAGIWSKHPEMMDLETYSDIVLLAALSRARTGEWARAAVHFDQLTKLVEAGRSYYAFRALRAVLAADAGRPELLSQLELRGGLSTPYPGVHRLRLEYHRTVESELPGADLVRDSLEEGDRDRVCQWLSDALTDDGEDDTEESDERRSTLAQLLYGYCLPPRGEDPYPGEPDTPEDPARIRRAEHLYDRVDYEGALEELQKVDFDPLARADWCRGRFRLARTRYRLDDKARAQALYEEVVDACDRRTYVEQHIRSLFALGRRHYELDRWEKARKAMETLLETYPDRSHADDALLYLGRIARATGDGEREKQLVERALEDYPDGDMVHECVWEYLESDYRSGNYGDFIDALDELNIPDVDDQYFSQGRLLYFRARAESELDLDTAARTHFRSAWRQYPFSFYGYLSRLALADRGEKIPRLGGDEARATPDWFFDPDWGGGAVRHVARLGLAGMAAEIETGRVHRTRRSDPSSLTADDWWRLAYLHHRAGNYVQSHHIARRQIPGRPWPEPAVGRLARWRIAFPDPYRGRVEQAVSAEARQSPDARVSTHLPMAIMREESGFDADIESWAGAVGLMQLMPYTARHHDDDLEVDANAETLRQPRVNVRIGVEHLHLLAEKFSNHPVVMVAGYNAGMGAVGGWLPESGDQSIALWVEDVPYRQARNYAKRVIGTYAAYQWLAGRRQLDPTVGAPPPTD